MVFERQREVEDFFFAFNRYERAVRSYLNVNDEYKKVWAVYIVQMEKAHTDLPEKCVADDELFRTAIDQWMSDHKSLMKEYKSLKLSKIKAGYLAFLPFYPVPSMQLINDLNRRRAQLEWIAVLIHRIAARNAEKMVNYDIAWDDMSLLPEKTYPSPQSAFASIMPAFTNRIFKTRTHLVHATSSRAKEGVKVEWCRNGMHYVAPVKQAVKKAKLHSLPCSTHIFTNSTPYDEVFLTLVTNYQIALLRFQDFLSKHGDKVPQPHRFIVPLLRVSSPALDEATEAPASLSALALGIARTPMQYPFELIMLFPKGVDERDWANAFESKKQMLHKSFIVPVQADLCGAQCDSYDWVRMGTMPIDRLQRVMITMHSLNTIHSGAYRFSPNGSDSQLQNVNYMRQNTRIMMGQRSGDYPGSGTFKTKILKQTGPPIAGRTIMELGVICAKYGNRIVALNAASAYHTGGGTLTGGRHALEESWCIQSTLLMSLLHAQIPGMEAANPELVGRGYSAMLDSESPEATFKDLHAHIPEMGCLLSPKVEVFRESAMTGYKYLDAPVTLQGVASIAAYNKNYKMKDCPMDCPKSDDAYCAGMKLKFDAAIRAAIRMKGDVLVIPDVGCGVYLNDPTLVGEMLGQVLKASYGCFKLIVLTGLPEFAAAVEKACGFPRKDMFDKPPSSKGGKKGSKKTPLEETLEMIEKSRPLSNEDFMNDAPMLPFESIAHLPPAM